MASPGHSSVTIRELRGNLHIHTDRSDGSLPIDEIVRLASKCKLDFLGFNDHFAACGPSYYEKGVLIMQGTELNHDHSHFLAYNCSSVPKLKQQDGAAVAAQVKNSGGLGIVAHPFENGSPLIGRGRCYPWLNWETEDYQGIEIWNLTSQWRDSASSYWQSLCQWLFHRHRPFARGACPQALAKWDSLCQQRHVTAVAGSDLHAPWIKAWGIKFKILHYSMLLAAVNTYCLAEVTGEAEKDGAEIFAALRQGRCWIAYDHLSLGRGFSFSAEAGENRADMGGTIRRAQGKAWLRIKLPRLGEISLIHNGIPVVREEAQARDLSVGAAGAYRVEARLKGIPWIYSNPIYIK